MDRTDPMLKVRLMHSPSRSIDGLLDRIEKLEAALHKINALHDNPAKFSKEIQDVLDSVIDTSDVKF